MTSKYIMAACLLETVYSLAENVPVNIVQGKHFTDCNGDAMVNMTFEYDSSDEKEVNAILNRAINQYVK